MEPPLTSIPTDFTNWFTSVTGHAVARNWQLELAAQPACRSKLIRIPTGLGKTEGVLAVWAYHRLHRGDLFWPRRLVWCLPMRALVEQTEAAARNLVFRLPTEIRPDIHIIMGGEDPSDWWWRPERPAILIGTQDLLLSKALNRGYSSRSPRWPVEFALLNNDSLWVMDEVQLMDVGLVTSAHLQVFRSRAAELASLTTSTWWMSATLQPAWLETVDTVPDLQTWTENPVQVPALQRSDEIWQITKPLRTDSIPAKDQKQFAQRILQEHNALPAAEHGRITLVVCNTVQRACETFDILSKCDHAGELHLVHSRFRPEERRSWRSSFLSRESCAAGADRIIVSTQVVEAGVDISAGCVITELAPWPSLVQRFGRCARYGGLGQVVVIDRGRDESVAAPYETDQIESAWDALSGLNDVGIRSLEQFEDGLSPDAKARLYPYSPKHLLLRQEFDELFDTTPDLTGADLDISRFIRSGDERDLQVCWLDVARGGQPPESWQPTRQELCAVPFLAARDWLCGAETKTKRKPRLRNSMRAWVWDWLEGKWTIANRAGLLPGKLVVVAAACGGYRSDRGFDPESKTLVTPAERPQYQPANVPMSDDLQQDAENLNTETWQSIAGHSQAVSDEVVNIAGALHLPAQLQTVLKFVARWHDLGKAHDAFQGSIRGQGRPSRKDIAKAPDRYWLRRNRMYSYADDSEQRPGFRHELASALGVFSLFEKYAPQHDALLGPWKELLVKPSGYPPEDAAPAQIPQPIAELLNLSVDDFDLLVYLIASHHGKVRVALHAAPRDQDYNDRDGRGLPIRGVREGDILPAVSITAGEAPLPEISLTLEPACLGLSSRTGRSWRERTTNLQKRWGTCGLALLEAVFRAADIRASLRHAPDPSLEPEINT